MISVVLDSTITCPVFGHRKDEAMPTNACVWLYECENCKAVLRPEPGDCCVYCSYGTNRCRMSSQAAAALTDPDVVYAAGGLPCVSLWQSRHHA
jgi:hypothetical protein